MDSLIYLLGIDVPENTTLQAVELTWRALLPIALAIVLSAAIVGVVIFLYQLEKGTLGGGRRFLMTSLRVALLALLVILLFRPVLVAEFEGQRPRSIALLLDNSQSMTQQDRRLTEGDKMRVAIARGLTPPTTPVIDVKSQAALPLGTPKDPARADLVRWILEHRELRLVQELEKRGPVRPFLFGSALHGTQEEAAPAKTRTAAQRLLGSFKANETRTNLADAINEILQRKDGALPAAFVVLTDGQDNASKITLQEAARECARYQVPLHIYGVGTAEGGSLQWKEVAAPETLFVEDTVSVPLRWRAQGFATGSVLITLTLGDKVVATQELPIQNGEDVRAALRFTVPKGSTEEEGRELVAAIEVKGNATFKDTIKRAVRVVDRKIRLLYIEHSPRFVYQFLMAGLLRDRRIEPTFLLVNADAEVAKSGPPFLATFPATRAQFFEAGYNVIILGDVASSYLGNEHMEWIRDFVQNRGGLIVIAGRQHMPSSYVNAPLAEVLPAEFEAHKFSLDGDARTQEYPVTLTGPGERSDMLALADTPLDNVKEWTRLPGFHWQYPLKKLRPGAVPLLVNPRVKMAEQAMPLLAMHYYGKGQVLFLGSDETWRWRFNEADKITNRFWGQLIYQLGLPSLLGQTARRVQAALEHSEAVLDRPGSIYVRLLDKDYNPRRDSQVDAILEHLDSRPGQEKARKITLHAIAGRPGEYSAWLTHDQPGNWALKVNNPETNIYEYRVNPPPRHELEETGLAEKALRQMAQISGGKFYREEDLVRLADNVEPRFMAFTRRQEIVLWNLPVLLLFVTLITCEWLLRKFAHLS